MSDGRNRSSIRVGALVDAVLKKDQPTGKLTRACFETDNMPKNEEETDGWQGKKRRNSCRISSIFDDASRCFHRFAVCYAVSRHAPEAM